ncbi:MAG: D-alanyl-D-alanine carboxypeptidase/D-alanyl-D-alanine-endopeptidase [Chitinophagales bacterium]
MELKKALINAHVQVDEQATTVYAMKRARIKVNYDRKVIYTQYSPTLQDIVAQTNLHSINLYAETLLKTIGLVVGKDGSVSTGQKMMKNYWAATGIDISGYNQEDGSGLSRLNYLTTHQMASFLAYEMKQPSFASFKNSLPIAGQTGTLQNIADHTTAEGKIFAKSGSMYKVRSYSGYVLTKNGDLLTFSVMVDNYTCGSAEIRSKLEKIMIWMAAL